LGILPLCRSRKAVGLLTLNAAAIAFGRRIVVFFADTVEPYCTWLYAVFDGLSITRKLVLILRLAKLSIKSRYSRIFEALNTFNLGREECLGYFFA
jgi:hypothetical protein